MPPPPSANTGRTYMATTAPMTRSCTNTLFILFIFPSLSFVRSDKTLLTSRRSRNAKSMPTREVTAGRSRFRPSGWIYEGVWVAGETVAIPMIVICLHMDRNRSSIELDAYSCPATLAAQRLPGLHISMCIAQRHVQAVALHFHEEASFALPSKSRGDWLQRERQGAGESAPMKGRTV